MSKMIGVLPARAGSKRLPGKNKKIINGKMLFEYSLIPALASELDQVIITTDDQDIIEKAKTYESFKIIINERPEYLAADGTTTEETLKYCIEKYNLQNDTIYLLQPTNPTRTVVQINQSIDYFQQNKCQDLISVGPYEEKSKKEIIIDKKSYQINGTIFINTAKDILAGSKMGENKTYYIMDEVSNIDIDELSDFEQFTEYVKGEIADEQ